MYKTEKRNVQFFRLFSRRLSGFQTAFNRCSKASQISRPRGFLRPETGLNVQLEADVFFTGQKFVRVLNVRLIYVDVSEIQRY